VKIFRIKNALFCRIVLWALVLIELLAPMFVCVDIYNRTEADLVLLLGLAMMICGLTLLIKNVVLLFVVFQSHN